MSDFEHLIGKATGGVKTPEQLQWTILKKKLRVIWCF